MTTQLHYYTLNDFENIIFEGFNYKLSGDVVDIIKNLEHSIQITDTYESNKVKKNEKIVN